jgi:hypothetical protein
MEMVQQAVADHGRKGSAQGGRVGKGQLQLLKPQLRPRPRMALLMFCGKGHHAGRPIETQDAGPGQGCGEAKADIARPAAQIHDPSSGTPVGAAAANPVGSVAGATACSTARGRRPGRGEWLPQQRQETLRKCLVGAIEISLGVGPRLEGIIH